MSRKLTMTNSTGAWLLLWIGLALAPARAAERPNVLFLFNDDHRADALGAAGNPIVRTPHMDRLAARGLNFRRAYMQGGFTGATCVPSRAMLMSGQNVFHVDTRLVRDETWPAAFARSGYTTFVSGKWHNGAKSVLASFQQGRALFMDGMSRNPLKDDVQDFENGGLSAPRPAGQHLCAEFADEAIRFLQQHQGGPFLCYVPFDGPHDPHIVPDDYPVRYDPAQIPLPPNFLPEHPFTNGEMRIRDEMLLPHPRPPEKVRQMLADYYRYVSYLDMLAGRILDTLAASPHASNTLVVFAGDSGVARGSHGLIGKQNLYEHSVRVPLIVAGPGVAAGKSTDALCYLYDVFPTLGAWCGVPPPPASEGRDLTAVLREPTQPGRPELVFAYKGLQRALVTPDWKLIRYPRANETQLFDLRNDPHEIQDLAEDPAQAARVRALNDRMKESLAQSGDLKEARNDDAP
jgi:arylsulfatase A-like enzyme